MRSSNAADAARIFIDDAAVEDGRDDDDDDDEVDGEDGKQKTKT